MTVWGCMAAWEHENMGDEDDDDDVDDVDGEVRGKR